MKSVGFHSLPFSFLANTVSRNRAFVHHMGFPLAKGSVKILRYLQWHLLRSQLTHIHTCHCFCCLVTILDSTHLFQTFLTFILHPRLVTTPHVHMTYVYSFSYIYVPHFTRSHGQEKSLSYYDLFDFGVLLYGHIPTLIPPFFLHHSTTQIFTINIFIVWANLQEHVTWT